MNNRYGDGEDHKSLIYFVRDMDKIDEMVKHINDLFEDHSMYATLEYPPSSYAVRIRIEILACGIFMESIGESSEISYNAYLVDVIPLMKDFLTEGEIRIAKRISKDMFTAFTVI